MGAKFLCCLPLRFGVLLISFIQFLASVAVTGIVIWGLYYVPKHQDNTAIQISQRTKIVAIVIASVYGVMAVISLGGFIGAIAKKARGVRIFSTLLNCLLFLNFAAAVTYIIIFFVDKKKFDDICIGGSTSQTVIDNCNSANIAGWVVIVSAIIPLLIQAYGCYIVSAYATHLQNASAMRNLGMPSNTKYQPIHEETYPLTHPGGYPYADSSNSYQGNHNTAVLGAINSV